MSFTGRGGAARRAVCRVAAGEDAGGGPLRVLGPGGCAAPADTRAGALRSADPASPVTTAGTGEGAAANTEAAQGR
ncbi:hypothetical protein GCM10009549_09030 [Streptomyces thermoalcalitolerans]|uniref:Uncharacterized protein n=1 Tax=Streptomyces thermoalcalitolerans TaxID=65605 RepID=A0ABP3YWX6_9ACTN